MKWLPLLWLIAVGVAVAQISAGGQSYEKDFCQTDGCIYDRIVLSWPYMTQAEKKMVCTIRHGDFIKFHENVRCFTIDDNQINQMKPDD